MPSNPMPPTAENDASDEVVYGAVARALALAADDPDWMNVTQWPRVIPPGVTDSEATP